MEDRQKVVIRYADGRIVKGHLGSFSEGDETVVIQEEGTDQEKTCVLSHLKAIFFVKSFEGNSGYNEGKSYGLRKTRGQKIYIKFSDGESVMGFLEGRLPWDKGFFLTQKRQGPRGFFILPVDEGSNNERIFVVADAIRDITVIP